MPTQQQQRGLKDLLWAISGMPTQSQPQRRLGWMWICAGVLVTTFTLIGIGVGISHRETTQSLWETIWKLKFFVVFALGGLWCIWLGIAHIKGLSIAADEDVESRQDN